MKEQFTEIHPETGKERFILIEIDRIEAVEQDYENEELCTIYTDSGLEYIVKYRFNRLKLLCSGFKCFDN